MAGRRIFILTFLSLFILDGIAQENVSDLLLKKEIADFGQVTVQIPIPGNLTLNELSRQLSIASVKGKVIEIVLTKNTVDWFLLQGLDFTIVERPDTKSILTSSSVKQAMSWDTYPDRLQYDSIMLSFADLYPSICRLDTIGTSINGRKILVLKISDNPETDEEEPGTFYSSTIHGDETGGFILMLRLAEYLLKNYGTVSRAKNIVDNLEIWINPLANPDGMYRPGDYISSPTRGNANGVDLNRNFPDPNLPGAVQQKENVDMIKFMRNHNFVLSANFHAGVEVVNYPWDRWERRHADDEWFYQISRKYADTVHLHAPAAYMNFLENGVTNGWDWYYIYGGRQDFMTWELQGREVTIELDDAKLTPAANLNLLWEYNWRSLLGYLENALYGIHGIVRDKQTGVPVPAKVFITGYDKDSSHVYSDSITGTFIRMLAPGTYNLIFSATGYIDANVPVVVEEGKETSLLVEMIPILNPVDTIPTAFLRLYPNPATDYFKVNLPERQCGNINVKIYNSLGVKIDEYTEDTLEKVPLYYNLYGFPGGVYTLVLTNKVTGITDKTRFVVVRR
jgi:hypothetical protein